MVNTVSNSTVWKTVYESQLFFRSGGGVVLVGLVRLLEAPGLLTVVLKKSSVGILMKGLVLKKLSSAL